MSKKQKTYRFNDSLYGKFKHVCDQDNSTITEAFEQFMAGCVEQGKLVFPQKETPNYQTETRILADWLNKGKLFYRGIDGEEVSIQARLLWLLPKVSDRSLRQLTEEALKKSVSAKQP